MSFSQSNAFNPTPYDPGAGLNLLTGVRNYQAADAQAQAYQEAIDPQTGQFDQNKYNSALVRQGLTGTWGAGAAMQQAGQASSALGRGTVDQVHAAIAQIGSLNGILTPLLNQPGAISADQVRTAITNAAASGAITPGYQRQITNWVASQPPGTNLRDALTSYQWMQQQAETQLRGQLPSYDWRTVSGGTMVPYQGNPALPGYGAPAPGGQPYPLGITPMEAWGTRVPSGQVDAGGQPIMVPQGFLVPPSRGGIGGMGGGPVSSTLPQGDGKAGSFAASFAPLAQAISQATGIPVATVLAQAGNETGWGTSPASRNNNFFGITVGGQLARYATPQEGAQAFINLVNGDPRYRNLPRAVSPQQWGDALAQAGYNPLVPGGPQGPSYGTRLTTFGQQLPALGAVQPAQLTVPGQGDQPLVNPVFAAPTNIGPVVEQGAKQYAAGLTAEQNLPQAILPLSNAITTLRSVPNLTTGNIQDRWNTVIGAIKAIGIPGAHILQPDVVQWQELAKYLMQNARNQPGAQSSDLARLEAEASSPNINQQREAILGLAAREIGRMRFQVAQLREFRSRYATPMDAAMHSGTFNLDTSAWIANQDPVAYGVDMMEPDDIRRYYQALDKPGQAKFKRSLEDAKRLFPGLSLPTAGGG